MKCVTFLVALVRSAPSYAYNGAYCGNWFQWRADYKSRDPNTKAKGHTCDQLDGLADKITHLFYAFAFIGSGGPKGHGLTYKGPEDKHKLYAQEESDLKDEPWMNGRGNQYEKLRKLKKKHPHLKTLISVGGWSFNDKDDAESVARIHKADPGWTAFVFSDCAKPENRKNFVTNALAFVNEHGFDGIDLDWEYPGDVKRGGRPEDKENFSALLKEFRDQIGNTGILLSAAVGVNEGMIEKAYNIPKLNQYLDFVNIMTYDYFGSWPGTATLPHAQLHGNKNEWSGERAVKYYIDGGLAPNKIGFGWAAYARTINIAPLKFTGEAREFLHEFDTKHVKKLDTTRGDTKKYGYSEGGVAAFCEMDAVDELREGMKNEVYNKARQAAYMIVDNIFLMYDNKQSVKCKAAFIKKKELFGGFSWSIGDDMYKDGFPLHTAFAEQLAASGDLDCGNGNSDANDGGSWDNDNPTPGAGGGSGSAGAGTPGSGGSGTTGSDGSGTTGGAGSERNESDSGSDIVIVLVIVSVLVAIVCCATFGMFFWKKQTESAVAQPNATNHGYSPGFRPEKPRAGTQQRSRSTYGGADIGSSRHASRNRDQGKRQQGNRDQGKRGQSMNRNGDNGRRRPEDVRQGGRVRKHT